MLEIIAKVQDLGAISDERNQTIELSDVAVMNGEFCRGKMRKIVFLDPEEAKKFDAAFKKKRWRIK